MDEALALPKMQNSQAYFPIEYFKNPKSLREAANAKALKQIHVESTPAGSQITNLIIELNKHHSHHFRGLERYTPKDPLTGKQASYSSKQKTQIRRSRRWLLAQVYTLQSWMLCTERYDIVPLRKYVKAALDRYYGALPETISKKLLGRRQRRKQIDEDQDRKKRGKVMPTPKVTAEVIAKLRKNSRSSNDLIDLQLSILAPKNTE